MKQLFTPWRMAYILSAKQPDCIFCDMLEVEDDRDALVLHRGQTAFLVLNKYPYNNGHVMAVPYRHIDTLENLAPEELSEIMALVALSMGALRRALRPHGFNVGANVGAVAGAGVQNHVHFHVVPRWSGDTNFMAVFSETRVIPQSLAETYDQVLAALAAVAGDD